MLAYTSNLKNDLEEIKIILNAPPLTWISNLEDYEIIFPETAMVRETLKKRSERINLMLTAWYTQFMDNMPLFIPDNDEKLLIEKAIDFSKEHITTQKMLFDDLRIYLQNRSLNKITGNKIPERVISSEAGSKIDVNSAGSLEIQQIKVS